MEFTAEAPCGATAGGVSTRRRAQALDAASFHLLLRMFDADQDAAAREYARVHGRLVQLFARRGALHAEDLADITIDRVARRLQRGLALSVSDPFRYFAGVASFVHRESLKTAHRLVHAGNVEEWESGDVHTAMPNESLARLMACLRRLPPEEADLVIDYYAVNACDRVLARGSIAAARSMSANALRLRVHRIVAKLRAMFDEPRGT